MQLHPKIGQRSHIFRVQLTSTKYETRPNFSMFCYFLTCFYYFVLFFVIFYYFLLFFAIFWALCEMCRPAIGSVSEPRGRSRAPWGLWERFRGLWKQTVPTAFVKQPSPLGAVHSDSARRPAQNKKLPEVTGTCKTADKRPGRAIGRAGARTSGSVVAYRSGRLYSIS